MVNNPSDQETWVDVPGYEGFYQVSDWGRVRSLDRILRKRNRWGNVMNYHRRGKVLTPCPSTYPMVQLAKSDGSKLFTTEIHRLVLLAFVGPCPEGMECCHEDGDGWNNQLSNLRWGTRSSNQLDRIKHGTSFRNGRHPLAKVGVEQVREIRRLRKHGGWTYKRLGEKFGITGDAARHIVVGITWSYVTDDEEE